MSSSGDSQALTLTTGGITLLSVLLSVSVSVGFGVSGDWWVRVLAGTGTLVGLIVAVKLGTSAGRGPLAQLARWIIGRDGADSRDGNG